MKYGKKAIFFNTIKPSFQFVWDYFIKTLAYLKSSLIVCLFSLGGVNCVENKISG